MNFIEALGTYIDRKRSEGLSYGWSAWYLVALGKQVGDVPLQCITVHEVMEFLNTPKTSAGTWDAKYRLLRRFFDYWLARSEISAPPMPVKKIIKQKPFSPYIYTQSEIRALLKTTRGCQKAARCCIDPITLRTVLIFIYGTGALIGEAVRLLGEDIDFKKGVITIRHDRFNRVRAIPIGPHLKTVLGKYSASKRRRGATNKHFFLNMRGEALSIATVERSFKRLRRIAGICRRDDASYQPRIYDLRHTFAVHRIAAWMKHGADLNRMLPALSVYMGLVGLRTTEKYLSLTPERFHAQLIKLSPQRGIKRWRDDPALMKFLSQLSDDSGHNRSLNAGASTASDKDRLSGETKRSKQRMRRKNV
ncbi:tyrosine-type recombinase/integrase [Terriglobus albidus]|uniref:tyrosine-type recombinase/integrase n=1 Tax=Terriglobus albidus TaxID=1592106 RepID=UPI0021DF4BBB|nr:tyrosine-type recombinase/integrase [Terriglobus albidus]